MPGLGRVKRTVVSCCKLWLKFYAVMINYSTRWLMVTAGNWWREPMSGCTRTRKHRCDHARRSRGCPMMQSDSETANKWCWRRV